MNAQMSETLVFLLSFIDFGETCKKTLSKTTNMNTHENKFITLGNRRACWYTSADAADTDDGTIVIRARTKTRTMTEMTRIAVPQNPPAKTPSRLRFKNKDMFWVTCSFHSRHCFVSFLSHCLFHVRRFLCEGCWSGGFGGP